MSLGMSKQAFKGHIDPGVIATASIHMDTGSGKTRDPNFAANMVNAANGFDNVATLAGQKPAMSLGLN